MADNRDDVVRFMLRDSSREWQVWMWRRDNGEDVCVRSFADRWRASQFARQEADRVRARGSDAALVFDGHGRRPWG